MIVLLCFPKSLVEVNSLTKLEINSFFVKGNISRWNCLLIFFVPDFESFSICGVSIYHSKAPPCLRASELVNQHGDSSLRSKPESGFRQVQFLNGVVWEGIPPQETILGINAAMAMASVQNKFWIDFGFRGACAGLKIVWFIRSVTPFCSSS